LIPNGATVIIVADEPLHLLWISDKAI